MQKNILLGVVAVLILSAIAYLESGKARHASGPTSTTLATASSTVHSADYAQNATKYQPAKELVAPDGYINTDGNAIKLSDYIGKKIILVDFWTYSCINCQRTIPYLENWYKKYGPEGFVVVGVHTPEFDFEKQLANVQAGVLKFGITYPVVLDSENQTWSAYHNNYWPEEYLIDIDGLVREHNIGEGNYQETEANIQKLLAERAKTLGTNDHIPTGFVAAGQTIETQSPETYFDWQRNEYLGNGTQHTPGIQTLRAPTTAAPNTLYLDGTWNIGNQYAENNSPNAGITFHYKAKGVYFVASSAQGSILTIYVDGKVISADKGSDVDLKGQVHVKEPRLYKLIEHPSQQERVIQIKIEKPGLDAYTFTFG